MSEHLERVEELVRDIVERFRDAPYPSVDIAVDELMLTLEDGIREENKTLWRRVQDLEAQLPSTFLATLRDPEARKLAYLVRAGEGLLGYLRDDRTPLAIRLQQERLLLRHLTEYLPMLHKAITADEAALARIEARAKEGM